MTADIEALLQDVGNAAMDVAGVDDPDKLLLYCRVEEGSTSADVFFREEPGGRVWHILALSRMEDLIIRFWDAWKATPGKQEWRYIMYAIERGDFTLDLVYPDQLGPRENFVQRRTDALMKYFGTSVIARRELS